MAKLRFQANGVDLLIDGLVAAGEVAGDIRERLWQITWARGYQDVSVPIPVLETNVIEGFCVLTEQFSAHRTMVCIDEGEQLVGVVDDFDRPALGAKVRLQRLYGGSAHWGIKLVAVLGCGLQIRFDGEPVDSSWLNRLKNCLQVILEGEIAARHQIEIDRRNIVFVPPPTPFRVEMEKADKEIRDRVIGAGGYTEEESRALARARNSQREADRVVAARNKRLVEAYRVEVMAFRARIPQLRAEFDKKMTAHAEFRKQIDRFNETDAANRSMTDATLRAMQQLDTAETALLNVRATTDLDRVEENPRRSFSELIQTIDLLFELRPKRLQKPAAATGAR